MHQQFKNLVIPLVGIIVINSKCLPFYLNPSKPLNIEKRHSIKVLQFNTWASNQHPKLILKLIQNSKADIIGLEEVSIPNYNYLKTHLSKAKYPTLLHNSVGRLCLISKYTTIGNGTISQHPPTILSLLNIKGKKLAVLLTPTDRPLNHHKYPLEIQALIKNVNQQQEATVLLGDLNTTPWSQYFKKLIKKTGLHNTQLGNGILPNYPSHIPKTQIYFPLPLLPLDHILTSKDILVGDRQNEPYSGSDHLPTSVILLLEKSHFEKVQSR